MVLFNYSTKELTAKIVYYGPGLCGKTTNLQFIHEQLSDTVRGKMLSLATKTDRTLFFDFLPMDLGEIRGMKTRMQLYTVPGQVFYNETRKLVLKGVDGIVFVADSQKEMLGPNLESFKNLEENLKGHGLVLAEMPHVLQFNKRDLPKLSSLEELNASINKYNAPFYESVATTGIGVQDALKAITKLVLLHLTTKYDPRTKSTRTKSTRTKSTRTKSKAAPKVAETPVVPVPLAAAEAPEFDSTSIPVADVPRPAEAAVVAPVAPTVDDDLVAQTLPPMGADSGVSIDTGGLDDLDEIEGLVDEVPDAPPIEIRADSSVSEPEPVVTVSAPVEASVEEIPEDVTLDEPADEMPISVGVEATPAEGESVRLTDVVSDSELFEDPNLEVAQLAAGEEREILIPVQVGEAGTDMRRYKLRVTLRLDRAE